MARRNTIEVRVSSSKKKKSKRSSRSSRSSSKHHKSSSSSSSSADPAAAAAGGGGGSSSSAGHAHSEGSHIVYDNAEERLQRAGATDSMNWATRRRVIAAVIVLAGALGIGYLIIRFGKNKDDGGGSPEAMQAYGGGGGMNSTISGGGNIASPIVGLKVNKQQACYQDADCPDGTYCGARGYCIPSEMQPEMTTPGGTSVLGRGRGGEGAALVLSSHNQRGQH